VKTHGHGPVERRVLGSVADRVALHQQGADTRRPPGHDSHGEGGVRRWLVGSVTEKLMRQSVAPLVLVRSADRAQIAVCQRRTAAAT
jgi:hypothetical protein